MDNNNFYYKKKVLVAGGTGLVGQPLVKKLIKLNAKVYVASKDDKRLSPKGIINFYKTDLTKLNNCIRVTKNKDIVFNLLGITGSPKINQLYPASFMMSNLNLALNLLEASKINKIKNYLFTSTYGVYGPDMSMKEDNVWKTFPSEQDKYAGWAKRIAELQIEAYKKEFKFKGIHIVRPGNIFGPYSNFNPANSMVVSSLIKRMTDKENPLKVWGDGTAVRDFIFSEDVAEGMLKVVAKNIQVPINLGSGKGYSIKKLVTAIVNSKYIENKPKIIFDKSKPSGDKKRVLDIRRAKKLKVYKISNFQNSIDKTIDWYLTNKKKTKLRFNYFK
jgi:GDP-L-fucose synthase